MGTVLRGIRSAHGYSNSPIMQMKPITQVAAELGIDEEELELYGKYKAKLSDKLWERVKDRPDGKLVLVTAINPTPAGEEDHHHRRTGSGHGKNREKSSDCFREPSLGPVME